MLIDLDVSGSRVQLADSKSGGGPNGGTTPPPDLPEGNVKRIREEVLRPNQSDAGRPLPVASAWKIRQFPLTEQLSLVEEGNHFLPFIGWPNINQQNRSVPDGIDTLAEMGLPFALIEGNQWTDWATKWPIEDLSKTVDGRRLLDPDAPKSRWREYGRRWTDRDFFRELQERYPNPPRVFLIENNERYNAPEGANFRPALAAIMEGVLEGLTAPAWKQNARFVGYQAFRPPWDGGLQSYYLYDWRGRMTHHRKFSPQTGQLFSIFHKYALKRHVLSQHPEEWKELISWDGGPKKAFQYTDQGYDPIGGAGYEGWIQFGMWVMTPRIMRHYVTNSRDRNGKHPYFDKIRATIRASNRVFADPTLQRFWRRSELIPNTSRDNPTSPPWLSEAVKQHMPHRNFLINTSVDPPGSFSSWSKTTEIPVFALARERGGEYLVYAHAPLGSRQGVDIQIPGGPRIRVDVREEGSFYHVTSEGAAEVGR